MRSYRAPFFGSCLAVLQAAIFWCAAPAAAQAPDISARLEVCTTCHGDEGLAADPAVPVISGQEFYYLYVQLKDYAAGRRQNEVMSAMAADLSKDEMKALAEHFSKQPWPRLAIADASEADKARGSSAAGAGQCPQCHLGGYNGNSRVPRMAGQKPSYLEATMLDFKYRRRNNAPDMSALLESYSEEDIAAMAHFIAGL